MVKQWESTNAQVGAGKNVGIPPMGFCGFDRQGTIAVAGNDARPAKIESCSGVGLKTFVFVSNGTESCASERNPSYATKRKVLSFLTGNPMLPPNCCRFSEFFIGADTASDENASPGDSADVSAK